MHEFRNMFLIFASLDPRFGAMNAGFEREGLHKCMPQEWLFNVKPMLWVGGMRFRASSRWFPLISFDSHGCPLISFGIL